MVVRLLEIVTKPNSAEKICDLFELCAWPLARTNPAFHEGMCLRLRREPRILLVMMRWDSDADADHYNEEVFPLFSAQLTALADKVSLREFDIGVRTTSSQNL